MERIRTNNRVDFDVKVRPDSKEKFAELLKKQLGCLTPEMTASASYQGFITQTCPRISQNGHRVLAIKNLSECNPSSLIPDPIGFLSILRRVSWSLRRSYRDMQLTPTMPLIL